MRTPMEITRREALGVAGAAGVGLTGLKLAGLAGGQTTPAEAAVSCSTVTPEKEPGPFFVDVRLNRSDVRTDISTGVAQAGIPLSITLYVFSDDDCTPYEGAAVDIWNANAEGVYSDEASESSAGTNYLRGYQVTDANGMVQFTTNMPGWYSGRSMHLHVELRTFDSSSNQTFEWQTQLFFGDAIDSEVAATYPYTTNPNTPRVTDENDRVWQEDWTGSSDTGAVDDGAEVTPALTGSTSQGYSGTFNIILAGLPSANADGFGGTSGVQRRGGLRLLGNPTTRSQTRVPLVAFPERSANTRDRRCSLIHQPAQSRGPTRSLGISGLSARALISCTAHEFPSGS